MTRREPGLPASCCVERQLDAFLAGILDAGEAETCGRHLAGRVVAAVFALLVDAGQVQRGDASA